MNIVNKINFLDKETICVDKKYLCVLLTEMGLLSGDRRLERFIVQVNGRVFLQKEWRTIYLNQGNVVDIIFVPANDNVMQTILSFATMMAAIYMPVTLGFTTVVNGARVLSWGGMALSAGIAVGGSFLINSLFPYDMPVANEKSANRDQLTYTEKRTNSMGIPFGDIPFGLGNFLVYPDTICMPYEEWSDEQENSKHIIYLLYNLGLGEYEILEKYFDDTKIEDYQPVDIDIECIEYKPGETIPVCDNVVYVSEVANISLKCNDVAGPFIANKHDVSPYMVQYDIEFPNGLYSVDQTNGDLENRSITIRVTYDRLDENKNIIASNIDELTITKRNRNRFLQSYKFYVLDCTFLQVSVERLTEDHDNMYIVDTCIWRSCLLHCNSYRVYPDSTVIFTKITEHGFDNIDISRFNVRAIRKLPVWHPETGWTIQSTNSPIWSMLYIARQILDDTEIDLNTLYLLAGELDLKGYAYNAYHRQVKSYWSLFVEILKIARAVPIIMGTTLTVVDDNEEKVNQYHFKPEQVTKGSVNISYSFENKIDSIIAEYIDNETWKIDEVLCAIGDSCNPLRVRFAGCTDRLLAWRLGMFLLAEKLYRNYQISFEVPNAGFYPVYGDRLSIHYAWDDSIESISFIIYNCEENIITTKYPVENEYNSFLFAYTDDEGKYHGDYEITRVDSNNFQLNTSVQLLENVYYSGVFIYDKSKQLSFLCVGTKQNINGTMSINGVGYSDSVYHIHDGRTLPEIVIPGPNIERINLDLEFSRTKTIEACYYKYEPYPPEYMIRDSSSQVWMQDFDSGTIYLSNYVSEDINKISLECTMICDRAMSVYDFNAGYGGYNIIGQRTEHLPFMGKLLFEVTTIDGNITKEYDMVCMLKRTYTMEIKAESKILSFVLFYEYSGHCNSNEHINSCYNHRKLLWQYVDGFDDITDVSTSKMQLNNCLLHY